MLRAAWVPLLPLYSASPGRRIQSSEVWFPQHPLLSLQHLDFAADVPCR